MDCVYCGADADAHDPVYVSEGEIDAAPMAFCNFACLTTYVDEQGLTDGACCTWSPESPAGGD